jgi:hypothetical protein
MLRAWTPSVNLLNKIMHSVATSLLILLMTKEAVK